MILGSTVSLNHCIVSKGTIAGLGNIGSSILPISATQIMLKRSRLVFVFSSITAILFGAKKSNSFSIHSYSDNFNRQPVTKIKSRFGIKMSSNVNEETATESLPAFPNRIPDERLGTKHDSLEAFYKASFGTTLPPSRKTKEYTLIVVTETLKEKPKQQRILLGLKNRGFGMGKYNSFGGKFLHDETNSGEKETVEECACRELEEETNLTIPLQVMKASKVGIQRFTFSDNEKEMVVHLFFLDLASRPDPQPYEVKPRFS